MIYELVMKYTLYDQECNNRFHFTSPATGDLPGGAQDLTDGFVLGSMRDALLAWWTNVNSPVWHTVSTRALYDPSDFGEAVLLGLGGSDPAGEAVASSSALGFRSARFRTGRNRGYKRFSGYGEQHVSGNTFTNVISAQTLAATLNDLVTGVGLGELYGPRVLLLDEPTPGVYKIFPSETEQRLNMSPFGLDWTPNVFVTTQRSRLPGHGE